MTGPVSRREFLLSSVAAVGSLALTSRLSAGGHRPQRIVVIGAGMAGLSAALELTAQGHDVTILEARTRPGGRVLTVREPFADGLYAEAGAMQVFDSHVRAQRYIQQLGLEIHAIQPAAPGSVMHVLGKRIEMRPGERVSWPFELNPAERELDSRALWQKYVVPELSAIGEAEAQGDLLSTFAKYDRMTFADFLRAQGASPAAIAILSVGLPMGLGDGADHHSALNLLREAMHRQARKQSFTIRGGTDHLPRALAARLVDRIQYGTPVVRLEQDADGARAIALHAGITRSFTCDRVVCTVPVRTHGSRLDR
jgi:monoamine oxidase